MQVMDHIEDLDEGALLDRLDFLHATERRTQAEVLQLAVQFAILHDEHTLDPRSRDLDGRERAVAYGGAGTPLVTEFCAADFGARLQLSPYAARQLIADALDLVIRLPQLWRRVQALEVKAPTRGSSRGAPATSPSSRRRTSTRASPSRPTAASRGPVSRRSSTGAIAASDPEAAAEREEAQAGASSPGPPGPPRTACAASTSARTSHVIARLDATVAHRRRHPGRPRRQRSDDERRVKAVLVLADPHQAVRPS